MALRVNTALRRTVQSIKHGCEIAGLRTGGVRAPLQTPDEPQKAARRAAPNASAKWPRS